MRTIAIDDPGICQSVCLSVTKASCDKTAERIDVLFRWRLWVTQVTLHSMLTGGTFAYHIYWGGGERRTPIDL